MTYAERTQKAFIVFLAFFCVVASSQIRPHMFFGCKDKQKT